MILQCEKMAFEKHGGMEGIEQHRRGLQEVRQERRALKRVTDRQKVEFSKPQNNPKFKLARLMLLQSQLEFILYGA